MRISPSTLGVMICLPLAWLALAAGAEEAVNYDLRIRPILSDNCYKCHGPDQESRKANLRFDTKDGADHPKDRRTIIAPGDSAHSELIRRITSSDPDTKMPPPDSQRKLTSDEIQLIKKWVDQGGRWTMHWAFVAPKRATPPTVSDHAWPHNAIDDFIAADLSKAGLKPSPPATKEILLRRVSLDLTGLPPTPAELDDFLRDKTPGAYEKVVDRLLASPRYGERMAVPWLDLARFADTHGYQADRYRPMWPYRDWVIKAFNENQPYDQFVTWQLAGDLLPHATKEQRLATAFNRLHMQNEEGGIVAEEYRVTYNMDRVNTFATAFLGLTFQCSRCHDHKFDPITQKDYYSLFAFFQNIDESGQTTAFTDPIAVPTLILSTDAQDRQVAVLKSQAAKTQAELQSVARQSDGPFNQWLAQRGKLPKRGGLIADFSFDQLKGGKIANAADPSKPGVASDKPQQVEGKFGNAALLNGENGFHFPDLGTFSRVDPFSLSIWLKTPAYEPRMVVVHHSKAPIDAGSRGYELLLEDGHVAFGLHHMWPGNSIKVVTRQAVALNQWTNVAVSYDGSSRAGGVRIYLNGVAAPLEVVRDNLYKDITYGGKEPDLAIGYRFRDNGFKGGQVDQFKVFNRAITPLEASELAGRDDLQKAWNAAPEALSAEQRQGLRDYFLDNVYPPARKLSEQLHALRKAANDIINPIPEIMVMQELPKPKPCYILKRGNYDAHGAEVWAETPAVLPAMAPGEPKNRLGLAHWLFAPSNPLAARVAVNRLWQQMFGQGIVSSSDNLGCQGSPPTHPQLLDWLACEFQAPAQGTPWDVKRMLKLMAMSATYRQASRADPQELAADPEDRLLERGPARRLSAEMLRDQALFDSGLLVEKLGGPSVKPYQPPNLWDVAMGHPHYDQGHGDDLHRRSLYTFWKRTVPPPNMLAFDAADRSDCVVQRQSTSTPLQSLALLNDVQITEAARFISQRAIKEGGPTPDTRVAWAYRLITDRDPTSRQLPILRQIFDEQRQLFSSDQQSAKKLLSVGEARNDPSLDPLDLAAGTVLAEAILNDDDAIERR